MLKPIATILSLGLVICLIMTVVSYFRKKPVKKYLIGTLVFFVLFAALSPMLPDPKVEEAAKAETANIIAIKNSLKVDDAKAKSMWDVLKSVGYTKVDEVTGKFGSELGLTIRSPQTAPAIAVMMTDKDGKPEKIVFKNQVLYENGAVKGNLKDNILGKDDKFRVVNAVERAIKKNAHDPSSVEMVSNDQQVYKQGGVFEARGKFRAKNKLGALTLHTYEAYLDSNYKVRELREIN